jgi:hypothetical protein
MKAALLLLPPLLLLVSCVSRPLHIASGQSWTLPLVAPLENGELVVAATIEGKGPFLFIIDPTGFSYLDGRVGEVLELTSRGPVGRRIPPVYEVNDWRSGDLHMTSLDLVRTPAMRTLAGRPIAGVIGREFLSNFLVYDVDRDAGRLRISVRDIHTFPTTPPIDASDWPGSYGTRRHPATWFLSGQRIVYDQREGRIYVLPREPSLGRTALARLSRWGEPLAGCGGERCVSITYLAQSFELTTYPLPGVPRYEVLLEAVDENGDALDEPLWRITVEGERHLSVPRRGMRAYDLRVVDVSPFPAQCTGGCVSRIWQ